MKIFSLETKRHLIWWSVGIGLLAGLLANQIKTDFYICTVNDDLTQNFRLRDLSKCDIAHDVYGWPFKSDGEYFSYEGQETSYVSFFIPIFNISFFMVVILIALGLFRYFKYKSSGILFPR